MEFDVKYTTVKDNLLAENKEKIVLSDDFYALGEMLQEIIKKLNWLGVKL